MLSHGDPVKEEPRHEYRNQEMRPTSVYFFLSHGPETQHQKCVPSTINTMPWTLWVPIGGAEIYGVEEREPLLATRCPAAPSCRHGQACSPLPFAFSLLHIFLVFRPSHGSPQHLGPQSSASSALPLFPPPPPPPPPLPPHEVLPCFLFPPATPREKSSLYSLCHLLPTPNRPQVTSFPVRS